MCSPVYSRTETATGSGSAPTQRDPADDGIDMAGTGESIAGLGLTDGLGVGAVLGDGQAQAQAHGQCPYHDVFS
jgi:hypothetical protein